VSRNCPRGGNHPRGQAVRPSCGPHADVDFQFWVEQASRPLLHRAVITYRNEVGAPSSGHTLGLDFAPALNEEQFRLCLHGSSQIRVPAQLVERARGRRRTRETSRDSRSSSSPCFNARADAGHDADAELSAAHVAWRRFSRGGAGRAGIVGRTTSGGQRAGGQRVGMSDTRGGAGGRRGNRVHSRPPPAIASAQAGGSAWWNQQTQAQSGRTSRTPGTAGPEPQTRSEIRKPEEHIEPEQDSRRFLRDEVEVIGMAAAR